MLKSRLVKAIVPVQRVSLRDYACDGVHGIELGEAHFTVEINSDALGQFLVEAKAAGIGFVGIVIDSRLYSVIARTERSGEAGIEGMAPRAIDHESRAIALRIDIG